MNSMKSILVLEDEVGIRFAIVRALELRGYRVFSAEGFEQAQEILRREPIQIAISDLRLSAESGISIIEKLQAIRPTLRPIFMTGYGSLDTAIDAIRLQAIAYLTKPFKLEVLIQAIEKASLAPTVATSESELALPFFRTIQSHPVEIEKCLRDLSSLLESKSVEASVRARLQSSIRALVENAAMHGFANSAGSISISVKRDGKSYVAEISDNGIGFDASQILAESLSQGTEKSSGFAWIQRMTDDLNVQSSPSRGCRVTIKIHEGNRMSSTQELDERRMRQALWAS